MLERIRTCLEEECRLTKGERLVVGVSGGPDSLCLLDVLYLLGFPLLVAHFDHGLRPESASDSQAVRLAAESRGLPFSLGTLDVQEFARQEHLSLEEAGRTARYRFLFEQARLHQAAAVVVGHTADDQVETVLMHLVRGAALSGLRGMAYRGLPNAWSQEIPIVRPLLGVWRKEIETYLKQRGLEPLWDASNQYQQFTRNRLRLELIPYLETYNPNLRKVIWQMAHILQEDFVLLEKQASAAWEVCLGKIQGGIVSLEREQFQAQPVALQRALLRRAINMLRPGLRDFDFAAIERAQQAIINPPHRGQVDLAVGLRLWLEGGQVLLGDWETANQVKTLSFDWPQLNPGDEFILEVPGKVFMAGGWVLEAEVLETHQPTTEPALANADLYQARLDLDRLELPLRVRTRRPGELFRPIGMGGHSPKLSDYMINIKLPRRARSGWPLVCSKDEIVWVVGIRAGEGWGISPGTKRTLLVKARNPT